MTGTLNCLKNCNPENPNLNFFRVLCGLSDMMETIERKLFHAGKPISSTVSMMNGDFRIAGELMVMSVLQGGPAPCFLHSNVFCYLVGKPLCPEKMTEDGPFKKLAIQVHLVAFGHLNTNYMHGYIYFI